MSRSNEGRGAVWSRVAAAAVAACIFAMAGAAWGQSADPSEPGAKPKLDPKMMAKIRKLQSIKWEIGPKTVDVGTYGTLEIPSGYRFTGNKGTLTMMELWQNPTSGDELGIFQPLPTQSKDRWTILFEFDDIGYVKDADEEELDADDILDNIKEGNERGNEMRKKRGWATLEVIGWQTAPRYNAETKNLEWAIKGRSDGHDIVNFNTRILGRGGVMEANLLIDPKQLDATLPTTKQLLEGFKFKDGQKYAEYKSGDKIAKFGLAALIAGGAAAVAAKTGLLAWLLLSFKKLWKIIVVGVVAVGGFIAKLFGRKQEAEAPTAVDDDFDDDDDPART